MAPIYIKKAPKDNSFECFVDEAVRDIQLAEGQAHSDVRYMCIYIEDAEEKMPVGIVTPDTK